MDRATLLQIFQSRLERSDYSKLQKQGRTFYQEARRQASNTQARHIRFFFHAVVCVIPYVPLFSIVAVHSVGFFFLVFSVCVSAYTGLVVVVLVAVSCFTGFTDTFLHVSVLYLSVLPRVFCFVFFLFPYFAQRT